MSHRKRSRRVVCPIYREQDDEHVYCAAVGDEYGLKFDTAKARATFQQCFCECCYQGCQKYMKFIKNKKENKNV